jgi:Family of unknown function (DUF6069)
MPGQLLYVYLLRHASSEALMVITFDTAPDCVFLYSLFPASFLYTGLRLEYKKLFIMVCKNYSSSSLEKHCATHSLREQSFLTERRRTFMASTLLREHVALRKLIWVGPLTIVSTAIANLIIRTIAVSFFGVPETFQYVQAPYVIGSTIIFVLMALLAFVLVNRFARRPIQFYRILAFVVLCISFLSPVLALVGLFPAPGMTLSIFWTMILMHIVSAIIVVGLLTTLTRE